MAYKMLFLNNEDINSIASSYELRKNSNIYPSIYVVIIFNDIVQFQNNVKTLEITTNYNDIIHSLTIDVSARYNVSGGMALLFNLSSFIQDWIWKDGTYYITATLKSANNIELLSETVPIYMTNPTLSESINYITNKLKNILYNKNIFINENDSLINLIDKTQLIDITPSLKNYVFTKENYDTENFQGKLLTIDDYLKISPEGNKSYMILHNNMSFTQETNYVLSFLFKSSNQITSIMIGHDIEIILMKQPNIISVRTQNDNYGRTLTKSAQRTVSDDFIPITITKRDTEWEINYNNGETILNTTNINNIINNTLGFTTNDNPLSSIYIKNVNLYEYKLTFEKEHYYSVPYDTIKCKLLLGTEDASNKQINVTINNREFMIPKTNSEGEVEISLPSTYGNYTFVATYENLTATCTVTVQP